MIRARKVVYRILAWWRHMHDAPAILEKQRQIEEAARAHRRRSHLSAEMKRLRTERLRQQFGELTQAVALFVGGFAAYCLACPISVFA